MATPSPDATSMIVIRPAANPLAYSREELAKQRRMLAEAEQAGRPLPAEVQEGIANLERLLEPFDGLEEQVIGPGVSRIVNPLEDAAVSSNAYCGTPYVPYYMTGSTGFSLLASAPGKASYSASSYTGVASYPYTEAWLTNRHWVSIEGSRTPSVSPSHVCGRITSGWSSGEYTNYEGGYICGQGSSSHAAFNQWNWRSSDHSSATSCARITPKSVGPGDGSGKEMPCASNKWAPTGDCCDYFTMHRGQEVCVVYDGAEWNGGPPFVEGRSTDE